MAVGLISNEVVIVLPTLFAMGIYIVTALNWDFQLWSRSDTMMKKSSIMKAIILLLMCWLCLPLVQLSILANAQDAIPITNFETILNLFYSTFMYLNWVLSAYMFIYFTLNILLYLGIDVVGAFKK